MIRSAKRNRRRPRGPPDFKMHSHAAALLALTVAAELAPGTAAAAAPGAPGVGKLGWLSLIKSAQQKLGNIKRRHRRDTTVNACTGYTERDDMNDMNEATCSIRLNEMMKEADPEDNEYPSEECPVCQRLVRQLTDVHLYSEMTET